jgi:hypothetical protein
VGSGEENRSRGADHHLYEGGGESRPSHWTERRLGSVANEGFSGEGQQVGSE